MSRLTTLYHAHLKENEAFINDHMNGSDSFIKLQNFLQVKLTPADYLTAEELLNSVLLESEERNFEEGCKYYYGLTQDLAKR